MKNYPKSFMDKMEKAVYNLGKTYPTYGYTICADFEMTHLLYCDGLEYSEYAMEVSGTLDILCELGYLTHDLSNYRISAKGWEKISEMEKTESNNQGGYDAVICVHLFPAEAMTSLKASRRLHQLCHVLLSLNRSLHLLLNLLDLCF